VLLAPSVDRAAIDAFALDAGWRLLNLLAAREGRARQVVFGSDDGAALVAFVEDPRVGACHARIDGHDEEGVAARIAAGLRAIDVEAACALLPHRRATALRYLGVLAPAAPCEPFRGIFRDALASTDASVRDAARFALEASGWTERLDG
jgi:hypothetical protein